MRSQYRATRALRVFSPIRSALQSKTTRTAERHVSTGEYRQMSARRSIGVAAGVLIGIAGNAVALELTDDRVLSFHSQPSGGCPGLDWHLVAGTNNRLTGLIAWDDMKNVARVSGSANKDGKFHLALQPLHGVSSEGSVEGQLPDYNGWLTASVTGAGCPHQEVHVQWFRRAGPDSR